jgi:hypothetical protein
MVRGARDDIYRASSNFIRSSSTVSPVAGTSCASR